MRIAKLYQRTLDLYRIPGEGLESAPCRYKYSFKPERYYQALDPNKAHARNAGGSQKSGSCLNLRKTVHDTYYRTLLCTQDTKVDEPMTVEEYDSAGNKRYEVNLYGST